MTDNEEQEWSGPSRSAKKRAAKEVETIAVQLVELSATDWAKLPTVIELRKEIELARQTQGHSSRKRQMKHLAGVLRRYEEETEEIRAWLDGLHQVQLQDKRDFHLLEGLRDRICDLEQSAAALDEAAAALPGLDRAALTRLARSVHNSGDRKAFREIFRRLKSAQEESAPPLAGGD
ncbi:ribosome biogenesis factor YjgA [Trichloromonas sp.]|uniref:ribosome biogenesis factor YjgA n=1 Tax=Trichloromonas sp. TaxID=3069249 RepID=UPI003D813630